MPSRNTFVRSLHDLGIAAWFGGSLMGAVGLNGAAATAAEPPERLRVASEGWARWAPVQLAAIVTHGVGGIGLLLANKTRLAVQRESRTATVVKTIVTGLAGAASVTAALAGAAQAEHSEQGAHGVTEPSPENSSELTTALKVQKVTQWAIPVLTAVIIILGAQQGEQQRPVKGLVKTKARNLRHLRK
ncbi:hypothetical protein [Rathayibacter toxicus]|uniref:Uncharacterized protein n=1 Tax=Rathayibacter toxicus TaxID=145458 RepID=A0A2S5Y5J3_9MICO|nr:hypothetical protein [Rathayibacter toxicus]PPH21855.1 hypothetical protein C5D17_10045 [Rathayibacter toxicus]PPH56286.1 hypothetical protein C5D30_10035 [Rathayibacter toxicus]PPH58382.1 hypothetical protein C5C93_10090 [Rathayibacter toxicus]PPH86128.1 hypothetical protein C5D31_10065 [Rathayibacter toxicus]PPI14013.1 hypothetical protein C5C51_10020 [Rathayibacter toxicus]